MLNEVLNRAIQVAPSGDQMWSSGASGSTKFENNAIITINEFGSVVDQPLYVDFCDCGIYGCFSMFL